MALALPLAILDTSGTASSIARFTSGNATPPKLLKTLGIAEGQSAPYCMRSWVGCVAGSTATLNNYFNCGYSGGVNHGRCSCIIYSPALGGTQTWCLCTSIDQYAYSGGNGDARSCVRIFCNGTAVFSRGLSSLGGSGTCCNTEFFNEFIDSNDTIVYMVCGYANYDTGPGISRTDVCMHVSFGNVNGTVILGTPKEVVACATDFS